MNRLLLLGLIFLSGCATTNMTGFKDPAYQDYKVQSVLISMEGGTLEDKIAAENAFMEAISSYNVTAYKMSEVFPPTRPYSIEQIIAGSKEKNIDTILSLTSKNHDIKEKYVPAVHHPGTSTSHISGYGNYATVHTTHSPGYTTGGYTVGTPVMGVDVILFDIQEGTIIWKGEGKSMGIKYATFSDLAESAAKTAVSELHKANLIDLAE